MGNGAVLLPRGRAGCAGIVQFACQQIRGEATHACTHRTCLRSVLTSTARCMMERLIRGSLCRQRQFVRVVGGKIEPARLRRPTVSSWHWVQLAKPAGFRSCLACTPPARCTTWNRALCTVASDGSDGDADGAENGQPVVLYRSEVPVPVKLVAAALSFQAITTIPLGAYLTYMDIIGVRSSDVRPCVV